MIIENKTIDENWKSLKFYKICHFIFLRETLFFLERGKYYEEKWKNRKKEEAGVGPLKKLEDWFMLDHNYLFSVS